MKIDMSVEIYVPIYFGSEITMYEVSNFGHIRNKLDGLVLSPGINRGGYAYVNIRHNGKSYNKRVHRLVAKAFIPNPENKPTVNHINIRNLSPEENKLDNAVDNLEWATHSEQNQHALKAGLRKKLIGEQVHTSKLTESIVYDICELLEDGNLSVGEISETLNISRSLVEGILYRGHWKHISSQYNIFKDKVKKKYKDKGKPMKLSEDIVLEILVMRDNGYSYPKIKKHLLPIEVSKETLHRICNGVIWKPVYIEYINASNKSSTTIENDEYYTIDIH